MRARPSLICRRGRRPAGPFVEVAGRICYDGQNASPIGDAPVSSRAAARAGPGLERRGVGRFCREMVRVALFPLFVELQNAPCLIVGGGQTAVRKAQALLESGARLQVIAPRLSPALRHMPIMACEREVQPGDVRGMALVVDATGSAAVGEMLRRECAAQRVLLNVVDQPALCSAIFPAILRRGPLVAGICTGGASPLAAAWARDRLDECLPQQLDGILLQMKALRRQLKESVPGQPRRAACLRACLDAALKQGRPLTADEASRLMRTAREAGEGGEKAAAGGFAYLVGAGCADRELITLRGLRAMRQADVILYDALLPRGLLEFAPRARQICTGKRGGKPSMPQEEINVLMIAQARAGRVVCRLKGGDPFVFGRGGEEALALRQAGIPYQVVPGISSALAVPALAGIPVTHRALSRGFHVVTARTAHGLRGDLQRLAAEPDTLIFLMGLGQLPALAAGLIAGGKGADTPAAVLGSRVVRAPLSAIAAAAKGLRPPAVIVVGPAAGLDLRPEGHLPASVAMPGSAGAGICAGREEV